MLSSTRLCVAIQDLRLAEHALSCFDRYSSPGDETLSNGNILDAVRSLPRLHKVSCETSHYDSNTCEDTIHESAFSLDQLSLRFSNVLSANSTLELLSSFKRIAHLTLHNSPSSTETLALTDTSFGTHPLTSLRIHVDTLDVAWPGLLFVLEHMIDFALVQILTVDSLPNNPLSFLRGMPNAKTLRVQCMRDVSPLFKFVQHAGPDSPSLNVVAVSCVIGHLRSDHISIDMGRSRWSGMIKQLECLANSTTTRLFVEIILRDVYSANEEESMRGSIATQMYLMVMFDWASLSNIVGSFPSLQRLELHLYLQASQYRVSPRAAQIFAECAKNAARQRLSADIVDKVLHVVNAP